MAEARTGGRALPTPARVGGAGMGYDVATLRSHHGVVLLGPKAAVYCGCGNFEEGDSWMGIGIGCFGAVLCI